LADIDAASCALKDRQQRGEKRAAAGTAKRAGDGVAERAEIEVLESSTYGIAANGTCNELDNHIDKRS
jgi:hypothetical protein